MMCGQVDGRHDRLLIPAIRGGRAPLAAVMAGRRLAGRSGLTVWFILKEGAAKQFGNF